MKGYAKRAIKHWNNEMPMDGGAAIIFRTIDGDGCISNQSLPIMAFAANWTGATINDSGKKISSCFKIYDYAILDKSRLSYKFDGDGIGLFNFRRKK